MSISRMYNQSAVTFRQTTTSGIKKALTSMLSSFPCHVQPLDAEVIQDIPGGFGKDWLMFCPVVDIREGDKITVDGTDSYRVTGVENYDFSRNPHLEVTMKAFS